MKSICLFSLNPPVYGDVLKDIVVQVKLKVINALFLNHTALSKNKPLLGLLFSSQEKVT